MEIPEEARRKALPLGFEVLNQVSEADLNAVPPFRARSQFDKWLISRGGKAGMVWLTKEQAKTAKNRTSPNPLARLALQATFNLKPARSSGVMDVCGACSSPGCRSNCLSDTGRFSSAAAQNVQQKHAEFMLEDPLHALALHRDEFAQHAEDAYAAGMHPVARFNTLSDIPYHLLQSAPAIIGRYVNVPKGIERPKLLRGLPGATFMDYTGANMRGATGKPEPALPLPNVFLHRSVKEWTTNARIKELADQRLNVALPVDLGKNDPIPSHITREDPAGGEPLTLRAYDSDRDDSRWADPEEGQFGALREKHAGSMQGKGVVINPHNNERGFIVPATPGTEEMVPVSIRTRPSRSRAFRGD